MITGQFRNTWIALTNEGWVVSKWFDDAIANPPSSREIPSEGLAVTGATQSSQLNIRSEPNTSTSIIKALKNVTLVANSGRASRLWLKLLAGGCVSSRWVRRSHPAMSPNDAKTSSSDHTAQLHQLMQQVGLSSFRALSRRAEVSNWQISQLRRGNISQLRVIHLIKLSKALQISLTELLITFEIPSSESSQARASTPQPVADSFGQSLSAIEQEYQRLQTQLEQQQQTLNQEFQRSSLQVLESWLLQWPTAAYAAQQNPQLSATKLLPLIKPVEYLLQQWNVVSIAAIGEQLPYDPIWHQLIEGTAQPGELVKVRYTGYRQGDKLLYRAKVSPICLSKL